MAAIVNYRDLLLQGAATRYVPPPLAFDPSTLGDLAYLDKVNTPQIQPGAITAGSGIVAPGAILTQALAPNAATNARYDHGNGPTLIVVDAFFPSVPAPEVILATIPTFGAKGGTVLLNFGMRTANDGFLPADLIAGNKLVVRRNGFVIYTLNEILPGLLTMPPVFDTPPSGTPVQYTFGVQPILFRCDVTPAFGAWHCYERSAFMLEAIR